MTTSGTSAQPAQPGRGRSLEGLCSSRRSVLRGLAGLGGVVLLPGVVVACGSSPEASQDAGAPSAGGGEPSGIPASDVAVGTAVVVDAAGQKVVVAQPTDGQFVAFSAKCTHQGTTVDGSDSLVVRCPNHGSRFDLADGAAVVNGPATQPLPEVPVTVRGDQLLLG